MSKQINDAGLDLIKSFEGLRTTVYKDIAGFNTVGWGHRTDLQVGETISLDVAKRLLLRDVQKFEAGVTKLVTTELNNNQFSALVSFTYNLGLKSLEVSHLLTELNRGNFDKAAKEFPKWCHVGTKEVEGLLRRREAEKALFLKV